MKAINEIIELFLGHEKIGFSFLNQSFDGQPYWYLVSKGMTKSSTTVILVVLLVLMSILLILIIWDRMSRKGDKEKIHELNFQKFDSYIADRGIKGYNEKILREMIVVCKIEAPDRLYKEIPFFEYKLDEFLNSKISDEKLSKIVEKNSDVNKFNDSFTEALKDIREAFDFFYRGQAISDASSRQLRVSSKVYVRIDKYPKSIETKVRFNSALYFSIESNDVINKYLTNGETVDLFYERDGQYRLKLKVIDKNDFEVKLKHTVDLNRTQKRSFVRYETKIGIRFKYISRTTTKMNSDIFAGNVVDISGGGMKFNTREKIDKDDHIIAFGMWGDMELKFKSKVLRVDEVETSNGIVYIGYCIFVAMDKQFVDKIVRKIFQEISKDLNKNALQ